MRPRITAVLAAALLCTPVEFAATPPAAAASPGIVVRNGATQPAFDPGKQIVEDLWVEVPLDSDSDGRPDRIHLNVTRPGETQSRGLKVASVVLPTPYAGEAPDVPYPSVDVDRLPQEGMPPTGARSARLADAELSADRRENGKPVSAWRHYISRGYAMIAMDSLGTALSTGCPDVGGRDEIAATRAVVDWLDGKGRAYDVNGKLVAATWSARRVAMYGVSYNGTLPIAAAITGESALKAIVPISAVTSWYDYYRANGLVVAPFGWQGEDLDIMAKYILTRDEPEACAAAMTKLAQIQDRVTGDYSPVWAERDYAAQAAKIRANVFVVQGLADWNVKPQQGIQLWQALAKAGGDRKLWLYDGSHGRPGSDEFADTVDRWIDHYLYGVDNGVDREPPVTLEDSEARVVERTTAWPVPGSRPATLPLAVGSARTDTFTDNGRTMTAEELIAGDSANRLVYRSPALAGEVRLSGTPYVRLKVSVDNHTDANLTAVLVDYGPAGTEPVIVTRGWVDPQNRTSRRNSRPVEPGRPYHIRWNLQPEDYVFAPGHQIGVAVLSTDYDYTLRPEPGTRISVDPTASSIQLPVVGGRAALGF